MAINETGGVRFDAHGRLIPEGSSFDLHAPAAVARVSPAFLTLSALASAIAAAIALPAADAVEAIADTSDLATLSVMANLAQEQEVSDAAHDRLDELRREVFGPERETQTAIDSEEKADPNKPPVVATPPATVPPADSVDDEEGENTPPSEEELAKLDEATRAIAQGKPAEVVAAIATLTDKAQLDILATDKRKKVAAAAHSRIATLGAQPQG